MLWGINFAFGKNFFSQKFVHLGMLKLGMFNLETLEKQFLYTTLKIEILVDTIGSFVILD